MPKPMTPAQTHDWLVKQGAERYVDTYLNVMKYMAQGGRTPGITLPSRDELLTLYRNTNDAYWQQMKTVDPEGAQSQLRQWQSIEDKHG